MTLNSEVKYVLGYNRRSSVFKSILDNFLKVTMIRLNVDDLHDLLKLVYALENNHIYRSLSVSCPPPLCPPSCPLPITFEPLIKVIMTNHSFSKYNDSIYNYAFPFHPIFTPFSICPIFDRFPPLPPLGISFKHPRKQYRLKSTD